MKLYYHPVSTVCRPVLLFAADSGIALDLELVDLFTGAQYKPEYSCVNPSCQVPTLDDGDFRLTECSAILKYLAEKVRSPAYPTDPQKRARVNERMDWFNTGFYREFAYNYVYPQIFPFARRPDEVSQQVTVNLGREKGRFYLKVLDECILGPKNRYVCGDEITIADYFGITLVLTGEAIGCDFAEYPNVRRWIANMKSLKNWSKANEAFYQFVVEPNRGKPFVALAEPKKTLQPA
jgi:glutathione S-transferase